MASFKYTNIYIFVFFLVVIFYIEDINGTSCKSLQNQNGVCSSSTKCGKNITKVYYKCKTLRSDQVGNCTRLCKQMILDLRNTLAGELVKSCDCLDDFSCIVYRSRFARCVDEIKIPKQRSCFRLKKKCLRKNKCKRLYERYFNSCKDMFRGRRCTEECLRNEGKLYEHKIGRRLKTCECDGDFRGEAFCHAVRFYRTKCV